MLTPFYRDAPIKIRHLEETVCSRLGKRGHCVVYSCGSMSRREHEAELKGTPVVIAMQNCPHTTAEQLPVQVDRNRVMSKRERLYGKKISAASEARPC